MGMRGVEIKAKYAVLKAGTRTPAILVGLCACLLASPAYAADDYLEAIEAEAKTIGTAAVGKKESNASSGEQNQDTGEAKKPVSSDITQELRDEFYGLLKTKSSASSRTYDKLDIDHQNEVVRHYFDNGKSMDNILMVIFEQFTDQVKRN